MQKMDVSVAVDGLGHCASRLIIHHGYLAEGKFLWPNGEAHMAIIWVSVVRSLHRLSSPSQQELRDTRGESMDSLCVAVGAEHEDVLLKRG